MINKFNNIEELNKYYSDLFIGLTDIARSIGLQAEESMRNALLNSYKNDLSVVVFNDSFEKETYFNRLLLERKKEKQQDKYNKKRLMCFLSKSKKQNNILFKEYKKSFHLVEKDKLNNQVFSDVLQFEKENKKT